MRILLVLPIYQVVFTDLALHSVTIFIPFCFTSLGMKTPRHVCFTTASAVREDVASSARIFQGPVRPGVLWMDASGAKRTRI